MALNEQLDGLFLSSQNDDLLTFNRLWLAPKLATKPYASSANAAPMPVIRPILKPSCKEQPLYS